MPLQNPQNNKLVGYGERGHDLICHLGCNVSIVASPQNVYKPRTIPPFHTTNTVNAIRQNIYGTEAPRIDGKTAGKLVNTLNKSTIMTLVLVYS
jgi:hypothetical protein